VVATATTSPLPNLSREDRQRLTLFFKHGEDFAQLADKLAEQLNAAAPGPSDPLLRVLASGSPQHSAPSTQHSPSDLDEFSLQTWASQPEIAAHIACRRAEADYRARKNAITFLEEVLRSTDNLIEKRRAATAILRILSRAGAPPIRPSGSPTNSPPRTTPPRATDRCPQVNTRSVPTTNHEPRDGTTSSHQSHGHESHRSHWSYASPNEPSSTQSSAPSPQSADSGLTSQDSPSPSPVHPLTCSPLPPPPLTLAEAFSPRHGTISSPPTPLPDPARSAEDLATLILNTVQHPDNPNRRTACYTLFNLAGHIDDRSEARFANFADNYLRGVITRAWNFTAANEIDRWTKPNSIEFTYHITLADNSTGYLTIEIRRAESGLLKDCWHLQHIYHSHTRFPRRDSG
jgi:hypothetical protein